MRFAAPLMLLLLPAVLVVLPLCWWWLERSRKKLLSRFAHAATLGRIAPGRSLLLVFLRRALALTAALAFVLALARPQWGGGEEPVRRRGLDVAFVLDLSQSMDAAVASGASDSRLAAAKRAVVDLLSWLKGDRAALVAFAGDAQVLCPLTVDGGAIRLFLDAADSDQLPVAGSDVGQGITRALTLFPGKERKFKVMVLLSDGEDHEGRALTAARRAKDEGVVIHVIGFGSGEGEPIPIRNQRGQPGGFKKDAEGHVVSTRLDEAALQAIAGATGGAYVRASAGDRGLRSIADAVAAMEKRELESKVASGLADQVEWPLLLCFVCLGMEALLGLFPARRAQALVGVALTPEPARTRRAAVAGTALVLLLARPQGGAGGEGGVLGVLGGGEGQKLYAAGMYAEAAARFRRDLEKTPESPVLHYNLGTALLKAGETDEAIAELSRATATGSSEVKAKAQYNIGNAYYAAGKRKEALQAFRESLKLKPPDRDAKHNYELARIESEKPPPPSPSPSPSPSPEPSPPPSPSPSPSGGEGEPQPSPGTPSPSPSPGNEQPTPSASPEPTAGMSKEQAEQLLEALSSQEAAERNQDRKKADRARRRSPKDW